MFKTIASFINPLEAYIAKGRLEVEGIPSFIAHEHHVWVDWPYSQALGGVKLQVHKNLEQQAMPIIHSHFLGEYESALENEGIEYTSNICQKCKSCSYKSKLSPPLLILSLMSLFIHIVLPPRRNKHVCNECGNKWQY